MLDGKSLKFFNIAPMSIGSEERLAADMIEYAQRTGNRMVLYSMTLHPEGFPATRKADMYIGSYRKLRAALAGSEVMLGVLIQSIMGHWPRTDKNEEDWTRTINIQGKPVRFCSFDQRYKDYVQYVISTLAKEKPCFFLADDDMRCYSPYAECFCPLHVAEFNGRTGRNFTSEEMRQAVRDAKQGDYIYDEFMKLQRDTVNGVAKMIRQAIDSVDPSIPAGCCMPGWEVRFVGETAKILAAKGQEPILRMANANYLEAGPKTDFGEVVLRSMVTRQLHKDIANVLDEADTFPHNLYSRCASGMHAKLCTSIMSGLNGAKLWLVNSFKFGIDVDRSYTDILAENQGLYGALAEEVKNSEQTGAIQPGHYGYAYWDFNEDKQNEWPFNIDQNWAQTVCAAFGIPFQARFELDWNGTYMLSGKSEILRFADDEIRKVLGGRVLIDGEAAVELCNRGFEKYLGVQAEAKKFTFNREYHRGTGQMYASSSAGVPFLRVLDEKAEIITQLAYAPFSASPDFEDIAPGSTYYVNELGGRVIVTTYNMNFGFNMLNEPRKDLTVEFLDRLNGAPIPYVIANYQHFVLITRKCNDGGNLLLAINSGYDMAKSLRFRCAEAPKQVLRMGCDGTWGPVDFTFDARGCLVLDIPLGCYGVAVLKFK